MRKQLTFHPDVAKAFQDYKNKLKKMYIDAGREPSSIDNTSTLAFLINGTPHEDLIEENNRLKGIIEQMVEDRMKAREMLKNINMSNGQKINIDIDNIPGLSNKF